ncbi:MAG: signal recognition particle protein Srp19, partial [Candidatus Diapherotrites archaeon CG_4_10_14_0_2_um_filter_31_5]
QLKAARKMGPLNKVMDMMGLGQQIPKDQLELGEEKLDGFKVIMDSMTKKEKLDPELLNHSRIQRIAKG